MVILLLGLGGGDDGLLPLDLLASLLVIRDLLCAPHTAMPPSARPQGRKSSQVLQVGSSAVGRLG